MEKVRILNLSGYMLGNDAHVVLPGQPWWPDNDTLMYVCKKLSTAREILESSRHGFVDEINPVWTTIYHVTSPMINCERVSDDMFWTRDGNRIIVDRPVENRPLRALTEEQLVRNAHLIRPSWERLVQLTQEGKVK